MTTVAYILLSGVLGVIGQILLKQALSEAGPLSLRLDTTVETVITLLLNPMVLAGLAITVIGTFFWLIALSRVDLGYAYPFASLNYIFILLASWLVFGELPSAARILGVLAICVGVYAISRTPKRTNARERHAALSTSRAKRGNEP